VTHVGTIQHVGVVKRGMEDGIQAQNASTVPNQANSYSMGNALVNELVEIFI